MVRVAVYDLGSSSFHLMVVDAAPDGSLAPVLRRRSALHLGAAVGRFGHLPPDRVAAAMRTVRRLRSAAEGVGADLVVALATAALREAENGPEVIAHIEQLLGSPVRVLDGHAEARLCFLGQRSALDLGDQPVLGLDLGGGSFEGAVGTAVEVFATTSVSLGANRLSAEIDVGDPISPAHRDAVVERVHARLGPIVALLGHLGGGQRGEAVVSGGTARSLLRLLPHHHGATHPVFRGPGGFEAPDALNAEVLRALTERLVAFDLERRLLMPGMRARRAPTLPVGALILATAVERLGLERLIVSERGLREGAVLDAVAGLGHHARRDRVTAAVQLAALPSGRLPGGSPVTVLPSAPGPAGGAVALFSPGAPGTDGLACR